ncbi:MAG: bacillithiol biosynthesis BshC, partial [Bdellovibrionales bacterium]|nr:bacillithiol biosynthesis BshC [Bdellovibrionales bacterium]
MRKEKIMTKDPLLDYLSQKPETKKFFEFNFFDDKDRLAAVNNAAKRPLHPQVLSVLTELNSGICKEVDASLEKLRSNPSAVVVTGQQLGFLGGPLHTLYKTITCIFYAKFLEKETGVSVVPVF